MILLELFNSKYDWHWQSAVEGDIYIAKFIDKSSKTIDFIANFDDYTNNWEVVFKRDKSTETTGNGDAFAIFSTVSDILVDFIKKENPTVIEITAEKRIIDCNTVSNSRIKLYTKGLQILSKKMGYTLDVLSSTVDAKFRMCRNKITENFGNSAGNLSPLSYQGNAAWRNEKDFFKKWFSLPYMTNGYTDQRVEEDAELKVTDEMIKDKIKKILKKYNITFSELKPILSKGQKVEFEHTNNNQIAKDIALDHIEEFLDYYERLEKVEENTTRTTKKGGAGTLKAKITKKYGGDVTCTKAKKLKYRKNATAHDKSQANWFLNMNCKENKLDEIELTNSTYGDNYITNTFNNLKKVNYTKKYQGYDIHTGIFNDLILIGIIDVAYILIYEKDNFNILGNSFVSPDFRGKNIKNLLIKFAIDELKLTPLVSDEFLTKNSLNSWLKLPAMNLDLKVIDWDTKEISNISNKNYLDKNSRFIIEEKQMLQKLANVSISNSENRAMLIEKLCKNFNVKLEYNIPLNESVYDHIGRKLKEKINVYNVLNSNTGNNYLIYETTCKFLKNKEIKICEYNHNTIDYIVRNEIKPISKILGVAKNNFDTIKLFLKLSEDGRIVKGVNTTVDVDVDGTQKQAKKFGNKVSRNGVPVYSFSDSVYLAGKTK